MKKNLCILTLVLALQNIYADGNLSSNTTLEYNSALNAYQKSDYSQAYILFSSLIKNNYNDIDTNFYLGRSAYEIKEYSIALSAYERILFLEPNNTRVKLEIAQTYFMMGLDEYARKGFTEVLNEQIPPIVRTKVEEKIKSIDQRQKKSFFTTTLVAGYAYDSNVYSRAEYTNFDIYVPAFNSNLELNTDKDQPSDSSFYLISASTYNYKINDNYGIENSFTAYTQKYNETSEDNDLSLFSLNIAPTYYESKYKFALNFGLNRVWLGHDSYLSVLTIAPEYTAILNNNLLYTLSVGASKEKYLNSLYEDRNAMDYKIINALNYSTNNFGVFTTALTLGKKIEDEKDLRTDVTKNYYKLLLGNSYKLPLDVSLNSSLSYEKSFYTDTDVNFLTKRKDSEYNVNLGISKPINDDFSIGLLSSYINNNSNHEPFEYDKYIVKAQVVYTFN